MTLEQIVGTLPQWLAVVPQWLANLAFAVACGALIGSERELKQRLAGLRTNALVALGSASIVVFSSLFPQEVSPTRMAAQVVSGIGFLGAGVIFRDGLNVQGLTTAATLWCAAAVGLIAGAGAYDIALALTLIVVFVNIALRPLAKALNKQSQTETAQRRQIAVTVTTAPDAEAHARALILRTLGVGTLRLIEVSSCPSSSGEGEPQIDLTAVVLTDRSADPTVEAAIHRLAGEPGLARVRWELPDED